LRTTTLERNMRLGVTVLVGLLAVATAAGFLDV
jgi:hypothetical protein